MTSELWDAIKWSAGLLVALLGYFLSDAHSHIKNGLEKKADQQALDSAFKVYRSDMHAMEERHKEETARLERQYEIRFAGVINQFSERINSMERNLNDKIDLMINLMNQRQP